MWGIQNTTIDILARVQVIGPTQGEFHILPESPYLTRVGDLEYHNWFYFLNAGNWAYTGGVLPQDEAQGPKQGTADTPGQPGLAWVEADTSTLCGSGGARPSSPDILWRPCVAGCISGCQRYSTHACMHVLLPRSHHSPYVECHHCMPSRMGPGIQGLPALTYFGDLVWQDAFPDAKGTAHMLKVQHTCYRGSTCAKGTAHMLVCTCFSPGHTIHPMWSVTIVCRPAWVGGYKAFQP